MSATTHPIRQLGGKTIREVAFTAEEISRRVAELGQEITETYAQEEDLLLLAPLKGSFMFLADLSRQIQLPLQIDFLIASSYGTGTESSGEVKLLYDPEVSLTGWNVVLVEDIIDTGTTLNLLIPLLESRRPKSFEVCTLFHKRLAENVKDPKWIGFNAPQDFLVGYGLDHSENFRHLPYVAIL
jgi:hypoxanthine phosphoribosyltransferase